VREQAAAVEGGQLVLEMHRGRLGVTRRSSR
jgi:hypothetical protein